MWVKIFKKEDAKKFEEFCKKNKEKVKGTLLISPVLEEMGVALKIIDIKESHLVIKEIPYAPKGMGG